jgi:hypothetical protein
VPDRMLIPDGRRRSSPPERLAIAPPPASHDRLLALARGAGNAAMARVLSPTAGRTVMRTHSAAGDLATADDVADLLEDRGSPPRARSLSAPPALGAFPLAPPLPVAEPHDAPSEPSPVEEEEPSPVEAVPSSVEAVPSSVEAVPSPAEAVPSPVEAVPSPPEAVPSPPDAAPPAPVDVAVPTPSPPRGPRIPKNPQPLPTHPTIGADKQEAFDVQAHAQFVRDELELAIKADGANAQVLSSRLSEVQLIAKGMSTDPLGVQRAKIAAADVACQPLRVALQNRLKTALEEAMKPGNIAYARVRTLETKARSLVARYEWPTMVTTLAGLENATTAAEQLETVAAKATKSVAYLKKDAQLDVFPPFGKHDQRERLVQIETWLAGRHTVTNLSQRLKDVSEALKKAEGDYTDIVLRPKVEDAVGDPTSTKKTTARGALKTLLDEGVVRKGTIVEKYRDTSKGPGYFGVEWTLEGTDRIVVHAHIGPAGKANDAEATHFKLRGSKLLGGTSIGMPVGWKGDKLMDPETNRTTPCPFSAA